jgi:hypothetical protein
MICACRELVAACADCCTGHGNNSVTANAARTTIIAESEFRLLPGYSQHPGNMPVAVIKPLY